MKLREVVRELFGVFALGLSLFLVASLLSFDAADLPYRVSPAHPQPANWGGRLGAWAAAELIEWLGFAGALAAVLALAFLALRSTRGGGSSSPGEAPPSPDPVRQVVGALAVVLTVSALERPKGSSAWRRWSAATA
ncbi:MAG: hypothetical protein D6731_23465, partial [Planctomycetota bacterium]